MAATLAFADYKMSHSAAAALGVVDTTSRLAQWRIHNLAASNRKSEPFKIGNWNWHISVEEKNRMLNIRLYPVVVVISTSKHIIYPIASFIMKAIVVCSPQATRKSFTHPEITDKVLKNSDDFVWAIDISLLTGKLIIQVEFLDLKTSSPTGGEASSIWAEGHPHEQLSNATTALSTLSRMLTEAIYTDITINASDGSIGAHRAVMASRSPVFRAMFSHDNLKETQLSAINISDMSIESCRVFLNYIYGNVKPEEFITHRLPLVRAADKYDMSDLKEACHKSLIQDINSMNVLERLQTSYMYRLPDLKSSCMLYLFKFGKVYDIQHELNTFLRSSDRDIITDIFYEILINTWKGF